MTWTPKVGEWVVDGETGRLCSVEAIDAASRYAHCDWPGSEASFGFSGAWLPFEELRPATIDEIPGNTATEIEHDRALCRQLGITDRYYDLATAMAYMDGMGYLR